MSCTTPVIRAWHECIQGFTQRTGQPTGMQKLSLRLGADLRNHDTQVELRQWHERWADVAEQIKISRNGIPPLVYVYAYSWGAGWGFIQLAKQLRRRGIRIQGAVLCDPVYRSRWFSFQWRSLIGQPRIVVPDNVRNVAWLYQRTDYPRGHDVVAANPQKTTIAQGVEIEGVVHDSMDECDEFYRMALHLAGASQR